MSEEQQPERSLTSTEAEELKQYLSTRLAGRDFSLHTEEKIMALLTKTTQEWYGSKDLTCPASLRTLVNPGNELWVDVGYLICVRQAS